MLFLLSVFVTFWFYHYNRFYILCYHEQMQLFRFDSLYFCSYLGQPGGLAKYAGSFLTQFYFYPVAGSIIIACIISVVFLLSYSIFRSCGHIGKLFFVPFVPAVLLMISFVSIHFDMSSALGILSALAGFRWYISLRRSVRFFAGIILITLLYFIAAGNALLLIILMILFELFEKNTLYLLLPVAIWSVVLPWLAWRMIYTVPAGEAFFALTPGNAPFPIAENYALWLSVPILYFLWRLMASKVDFRNVASWKILVPNILITMVMAIGGACLSRDVKAEILYRMTFEAQDNHWESVIALGKAYPTKNRLACYYTNLALANTGQMPYRMFHYKQLGVIGLFVDRDLTHSSMWYLSEIFYHLGMTLEAEHCAFEAMVGSPKEVNAQTLRRLTYTGISRRDSTTAGKYIRNFEHSLAYRSWAKQQRKNLEQALADSSFIIPDGPKPSRHSDFFIDYQYPDRTLLKILHDNPKHRMAFEYLMAYMMLEKDIEQVKWCMDHFFKNFDYPDIPVHYEEALMVYQNSGKDKNIQYTVSQATRERYNRYIRAYLASQGSRRNFEQLQKQFGDTYWFYLHFVDPTKLVKKNDENRY